MESASPPRDAHAGALRQTSNFMRKKFGVLTFARGSPSERESKSATYQVPGAFERNQRRAIPRSASSKWANFLEAKSREMIATLEEEMRKAAKKMDFEKAAELRNMIDYLRSTTKPTWRFTRGKACRAQSIRWRTCAHWRFRFLSRVPQVMQCFDISNISTTHVVASTGSFSDGQQLLDKDNYRRYRVRTVDGQDDARQHGRGRPALQYSVFCEAHHANSMWRSFRRRRRRMRWRGFPVFRPNACPRR